MPGDRPDKAFAAADGGGAGSPTDLDCCQAFSVPAVDSTVRDARTRKPAAVGRHACRVADSTDGPGCAAAAFADSARAVHAAIREQRAGEVYAAADARGFTAQAFDERWGLFDFIGPRDDSTARPDVTAQACDKPAAVTDTASLMPTGKLATTPSRAQAWRSHLAFLRRSMISAIYYSRRLPQDRCDIGKLVYNELVLERASSHLDEMVVVSEDDHLSLGRKVTERLEDAFRARFIRLDEDIVEDHRNGARASQRSARSQQCA